METIYENPTLSSADVARLAGIHKDTLLRWLRAGLIPEPKRDRHGWRSFSSEEATAIIQFASSSSDPCFSNSNHNSATIEKLNRIDWDFAGAKTSYLTHGLHPYPAKFIPQIPNALIQELSGVGDVVLDIFCGSGTTLVEALLLKRHAVGIDANPLACLISRAKTTTLNESDLATLCDLSDKAKHFSSAYSATEEGSLFPENVFKSKGWRPEGKVASFWFHDFVVEELAECLSWINSIEATGAKDVALSAFSSIVVAVSKQDSDTRYVRREKRLAPGETFKRFFRAIDQSIAACQEFADIVESRFKCAIHESNILSAPSIERVDLVVCSPPYPNAYSYHLYHMTRMVWLGMDQPTFKREEIGSHRKYSSYSKNAANVETFRQEFGDIMEWLSNHLKRGGYACFVVGDSTIRGERIKNSDLIVEASKKFGFIEAHRIQRTLQATKKAFNPAIGKIKTEDILVLQLKG